MDKFTERLLISAFHLKLIDDFFALDPEYGKINAKINEISSFRGILDNIYFGQDGRQMILSDLLQHVVAVRGFYSFTSDEAGYIKTLFYIANQLMLQENLIRDQPRRKSFLDFMERKCGELECFFEGPDSDWHEKYQECKTAPRSKIVGSPKLGLYRVIDSLFPKSLGNATELLTFAYLLSNQLGYVIPLLEIQQAQKLNGREEEVVPPDFLLIGRDHRIFGIEVGAGQTGIGKIRQSNIFMENTGIPVVTVNVNPPGNNASYRCPKCEKWILYCDRIINEYSTEKISNVNFIEIDCRFCPTYNQCDKIVYYGRIETNGETRHYHYRCVDGLEYVQDVIRKDSSKISPLYLKVEGLKSLEP